MARTLTALLMVSTAILAAPGAAFAQGDPEENLAEVREMVLHARYDEAIAAAEALAGAPGLTARQINAALELLATARIATGEEERAQEALARLYARDPAHRMTDPDASPRIASFFARARESASTPVTVSLDWGLRPSEAREAPGVAIRINEGADAVEEVRLSYRQGGDTAFHRIEMTREDTGVFRARIPLLSAAGDAYDVSFFIEAFAPSRAPLARLGSDASPLSLSVPAGEAGASTQVLPAGPSSGGPSSSDDDGGGIATKWWFWTLLVAIVAGGVVAAVLLGPASEGPEEGSLGTVTLGLSF